jgi:hypothetical protein
MDQFKELPREAQITLGALVLFVIFSFFDWQQVSFAGLTAGNSLWHGVGIVTVLIAIAYLVWEIARALRYNVTVGQVKPPLTSAGFSIALLIFTVITFLDWSDARHWPAWIGLVLSIVIAVTALKRARDEGVEMPKLPEGVSVSRGQGGAAAAQPTPPPPAPTDPAPSADEGEADAKA